MSLLPGFPKLALSLFLASSFLFLVTNPAFAQPAPPLEAKPCEDALFTNQLTKVVLEPIKRTYTRTGNQGDSWYPNEPIQVQVDFSKLKAIFAGVNSDYLESDFQSQNHSQKNLMSLDSVSLNEYYGPGQKAAAKVMVDQLKQKYVTYILEKPTLPESARLYSDIDGQNPKTIYDLYSEYGEPNPPSLGGETQSWNSTWGQYWEKIPTAVSEFYYGKFMFPLVAHKYNIEALENNQNYSCPTSRVIYFVLPEYFRTTSIANQINQLIVPKAVQSSSSEFVDRNLFPDKVKGATNILSKIIEACLKPFIDNPLTKTLNTIIRQSYNFLNTVAYAAEVPPPPYYPEDPCPKIIPVQLNDKEGIGPFCSVPQNYPDDPSLPEPFRGTPQLQPGECQNKEDPNKLDSGQNVICTFTTYFTNQGLPLIIGQTEGINGFDQCDPVPDSDQLTCTIEVRVYPIFYIPWLAPIWNNTTYSDQKDQIATIGTKQETGKPGAYTFFKPKSVDETVFPQGKNLPSEEQGGAEEIRQRFFGAVDDDKVFVRDRALKPCALQEYLGIKNACKTSDSSL